tara:strand:+ start:1387 stop:1503 length:117 start_codon:yes stop_codon:yes gene_type:complete
LEEFLDERYTAENDKIKKRILREFHRKGNLEYVVINCA